jgi:hypothetical protein
MGEDKLLASIKFSGSPKNQGDINIEIINNI